MIADVTQGLSCSRVQHIRREIESQRTGITAEAAPGLDRTVTHSMKALDLGVPLLPPLCEGADIREVADLRELEPQRGKRELPAS